MEEKIQHEPPKTIGEAVAIGLKQGMTIGTVKQDFRVEIAYRIKALRNEAKLTQEQMASKINVNTLTYRGYENCKSDIPLLLLVRIADVLNVSLDYITGRTETRQIATGHSGKSVEERLAELEKLVASIVEE